MIEEEQYKQEEFKKYLTKIWIGKKSEKRKKKTFANINKPFRGGNNAIKFVDDYCSVLLDAKIREAESEPKPSKAKTKRKKSSLKLHEEYINETKNDKENIDEQIFK